MEHITTNQDCDLHLLNFLFLKDIIKLRLINRSLNKLIMNHEIYKSILQINNVNDKSILETCYKKGLIDILQNYYQFGKNIIINDGIDWASEYGHLQILEWFKNFGFEFKYSDRAINYASTRGYIGILEWFKNSGFEFK